MEDEPSSLHGDTIQEYQSWLAAVVVAAAAAADVVAAENVAVHSAAVVEVAHSLHGQMLMAELAA